MVIPPSQWPLVLSFFLLHLLPLFSSHPSILHSSSVLLSLHSAPPSFHPSSLLCPPPLFPLHFFYSPMPVPSITSLPLPSVYSKTATLLFPLSICLSHTYTHTHSSGLVWSFITVSTEQFDSEERARFLSFKKRISSGARFLKL